MLSCGNACEHARRGASRPCLSRGTHAHHPQSLIAALAVKASRATVIAIRWHGDVALRDIIMAARRAAALRARDEEAVASRNERIGEGRWHLFSLKCLSTPSLFAGVQALITEGADIRGDARNFSSGWRREYCASSSKCGSAKAGASGAAWRGYGVSIPAEKQHQCFAGVFNKCLVAGIVASSSLTRRENLP